MFTRIVVPLSGHPMAERALAPAAAIAREHDAAVYVAMVDLYPADASRRETGGSFTSDIEPTIARLRQAYGVTIMTAELGISRDATPPGQVLARYVVQIGGDLVVMATHGRTGWWRALTGSVADDLLHHVKVPVLLVRGTDNAPASEPVGHRVMVALDGSELAEQAIGPAADLLSPSDGTLILAQSLPSVPAAIDWPSNGALVISDPDLTRQLREDTQSRLDALAKRIRARMRPAQRIEALVEVIPMTGALAPIAPAVVNVSKEVHADVVALTTHSRDASRVLLATVADHLLRATDCALLICHAAPPPRPTIPASTGRAPSRARQTAATAGDFPAV